MRLWFCRALAIGAGVGMVLTAAATSARASTVEAHVPFSFIVSGTRLPAGTYVIKPLETPQQEIWEVQNVRNARAVLVPTTPFSMRQATATPQLDFAVAGGQYFLAQIVSDYYGTGRDLDLTSHNMEQQLARADEASASHASRHAG